MVGLVLMAAPLLTVALVLMATPLLTVGLLLMSRGSGWRWPGCPGGCASTR